MIRRLLWLVTLAWLTWVVSRLLRPRARPAGATAEADATMVRDRICNTYVPMSRAIAAGAGADRQFFCSEKCRSDFLHASAAGPGAAPSA